MPAAGELVIFVGEFTARVQTPEDQFDRRNAFFRVDIHRHAATVINDFERLVFVKDHFDAFGVAS
ncbi:hypothetical protein SRABI106_04499 [Rahnella aquatilis]|nr:hypothetical protein SRABI106_04499 [Rahnella aquatilis]